MRSDRCRRFELAIASSAALDEEAVDHLSSCARCRALASTTAMSAPPVDVEPDEWLGLQLGEAVRSIAEQRRARWQRRRTRTPLLIGLVGYLIGAVCLTVTMLAGNGGGPSAGFLGAPPLAAPLAAPEPAITAVVLVASALWVAAAALLTRRRRGAVL
jgi:hypothetical protein